MLLQTNSYIVPKDKRAEHARLMRRFRQVLAKLGCDMFEVYEQVGTNWGSGGESNGRYVQIMRFRDRKHQVAVQSAERNDPNAQQLIAEFCELVNFPYQQQQGFFAVGFYTSVLPVAPARVRGAGEAPVADESEPAGEETAAAPEHAAPIAPPPPPPPPFAADDVAAPVAGSSEVQEAPQPPESFIPATAERSDEPHHEEAHHSVGPTGLVAREPSHPTNAFTATDDDLSDLHFGALDPEPEEIAADGPPLEVEVTRRRDPHGEEELLSEEELLNELSGGPAGHEHDAEHHSQEHRGEEDDGTDENGQPGHHRPAVYRHPPRSS
jgi:hypothetical protein